MQWPRHAASADCRESRSATSRQCASRLLISGARETPGSFGPRTFIFKRAVGPARRGPCRRGGEFRGANLRQTVTRDINKRGKMRGTK